MMQILDDIKDCCGCHACANACKSGAITMQPDEEGFLYPKINSAICSECGLCKKSCPVLNGGASPACPDVYACKSRDDESRHLSSSGGIFTLLAEKTVREGGVVFGVAFNEQMEAVHVSSETTEGLAPMRGSKYVQSNLGFACRQAQKALSENRPVLFTGTPCQIAGLRGFLRKDYDQLLCVDVLCHGVPSPLVFGKYVDHIAKANRSRVTNYFFRSKASGWPNLQGEAVLENGALHREPLNIYFKGFCGNLYFRASCYNCHFRLGNQKSDLTLGDYWGVEKHHPQLDHEKGISLVLVHTDKGRKAFASINQDIESVPSNLENAVKGNHVILESVEPHQNRAAFFQRLDKVSIDVLIAKCLRGFLYQRIARKLRKWIHKIVK